MATAVDLEVCRRLGDRAFCDFKTLPLLVAGDDHFLVRYHSKCHFFVDSDKPARTGTDANGLKYREEWGWLGKPTNPQRLYDWRITPTRPKDEPLVVVTSLLDADRYPAADLLTVYRRRWGIESMFLRVPRTFHLRHLIGATPQATVFQAVFRLLLYNITLAMQGYVATGAKRAPETISLHLLFEELARDLSALFGPDAESPGRRGAVVGRLVKRLHVRNLVAKIPRTRRWRVTDNGLHLQLGRATLSPELAGTPGGLMPATSPYFA